MKKTPIRLLLLLCAAALTAACSKDETFVPRIGTSTERIVLPGAAGSVRTFTVTANGAWELTTAGAGFAAEPLSGSKGETVVTLTATDENDARSRRTLGRLTLRPLTGASASGTGGNTVEVLQSPATAPQTMLLYMPGRSLLSYYKTNIENIRKAVTSGIPGDGRILVCWQPETYDRVLLAEVRYDDETRGSRIDTLQRYEGFSAASTKSVASLLADAAEYAPAAHYGLIVGCHGKAWVPAEAGVLSDIEFLRRVPGETSSVSDDLWHPLSGGKRTRSFGDFRREIDIPAFAEAVGSLPYRFDYLVFDACFMASIETLYDLRHTFDRIVAAPCEIMAAGFPYDRAVPYLFTDEGASNDLTQVCREFYEFYQNDWNSVPFNEQSGCISLCVTEHLDALADVVRRLYASPQKSYDPNAVQSYEGLATHVFYDLGHYVTTACSDPALLDEFRERMQAAFPAESRFHTEKFYSDYNGRLNDILPGAYWGVSTSEPSARYRMYLPETGWYRATH